MSPHSKQLRADVGASELAGRHEVALVGRDRVVALALLDVCTETVERVFKRSLLAGAVELRIPDARQEVF